MKHWRRNTKGVYASWSTTEYSLFNLIFDQTKLGGIMLPQKFSKSKEVKMSSIPDGIDRERGLESYYERDNIAS